MAGFTNEAAVRLKFRLEDEAEAPATLVAASIAHAHSHILARVRHEATLMPPAPVVIAETLLAGAALLRSLAARHALDRREARLAGHQLETGRRFPAVMETAAAAECEAARLLGPYLRHGTDVAPGVLLTGVD